jgi:predicted component of type VI protein secretion system
MDAKLVIVGGKASKGPISLKLPTIIGRSREADLTVAHPMVSRQHCKLFEVDGLLKICDLGSLNGTFVGQEKVTEADLHPQSQFTVGPLTFRVDYEYTGPVVAPAPADQPQAAAPQSADTMTADSLPDFLATTAAPHDETAQPQADPAAPAKAETPADSAPAKAQTPADSAPAETASIDFNALELDDEEAVETEPQPASDPAGEEAAEAPPGSTGEAPEETAAEPSAEVTPPALPTAAAAEKKGWWRLSKGKKPSAATNQPAGATKPAAAAKKPAAATKKPAAGKTSPVAKPAVGAPAPTEPAKPPSPSNQDEMPDFLAGAAPGAAERSKPADPEDDILGFLQ